MDKFKLYKITPEAVKNKDQHIKHIHEMGIKPFGSHPRAQLTGKDKA